MSEIASTPGPWTLDGGVVRACKRPVCEIYRELRTSPETIGNAALIVAAPDLYVLADHPVLEWICTEGLGEIPEPQRTSIELFLIPLRKAALAKARGEPSP